MENVSIEELRGLIETLYIQINTICDMNIAMLDNMIEDLENSED